MENITDFEPFEPLELIEQVKQPDFIFDINPGLNVKGAYITDDVISISESVFSKGQWKILNNILDAEIAKKDGEIATYYIYQRNELKSYLLNNTKIEEPSRTRHSYGSAYEKDARLFFDLAIQIRFT